MISGLLVRTSSISAIKINMLISHVAFMSRPRYIRGHGKCHLNRSCREGTVKPCKPVAPGSKRLRSAVTNGTRAYVIGDGNSPWARRQRDLIALHLADLGGEERLSENQLSLCRRAATLETELEMLEGQLSLGKVADLDLYNRLSGNLRRILESLGLERRGRDITPDSDVVAHFKRRPRKVDAE
jgi:hypothetical protein